ncbi:MAG: rRNA (cytosine967-C5)-methyltransferase [Actinomycetota bacterium]|nr:rRNA (cytosine967-C5)-methyltransferase [Actinomycetota bacterium]
MAGEALTLVEAGGYSNLVLPGLLRTSGLDQRDRAMVTDLVYGTLRQQGRADHLLARASHRPLPELDPPVRAALRLGAYQLLSGVAPHAAVGATVGALAGWSSPASVRRAAPYANAVLRRVAELGPDWPWPSGDDPDAVAVRTSHPRWIVELLRRDLGDDAEAVLASANEPPAVTLRPNPLRITPEALAAELTGSERPTDSDGPPAAGRVRASGEGVQVEAGRLVPSALLVRGVGDLARLPAVAEGRATPQDQASQAVATALGARPGERILDLAAAPGGKATALAEAMGDDGLVVAADLRPRRAALVRHAAARLGLGSVQVMAADGLRLPLREPMAAGGFDRVLLDAPCSGLGVLRRRPEARWRLDPSDIGRVAAVQRELLAAAMARVRPGGLVAYCVCTLTREETLDIDTWAADAFPAFTAVTGAGPPWRPHGRGALLLPTAAGTDGMFLLLLQAPGDGAGELAEPVR